MLKVHALCLGAYHTNCYILHADSSDACVIIDPGYEPERVLDYVNQQGLSVAAILLTHGHFDHVGGVETIYKATGCQIWMRDGDRVSLMIYDGTPLFPFAFGTDLPIRFCQDEDTLRIADLEITVISTPGHTEGCVSYRCDNCLFTGDTLFAGTCGRTDLPGGNFPKILESLSRLGALEQDLRVLPGHGRISTLEEEKKHNPYMRG